MDDLPEATPVADLDLAPSEAIDLAPAEAMDLAPAETIDLAPCPELPEIVLHAEVEETRGPVQPDQDLAHRTQDLQLLYQYLLAH